MDPALREYLARPRPRPHSTWKTRLAVASAATGAVCAGLTALAFAVVVFFYQTTASAYAPIGEEILLRGTGITTIYDRTGEPLGVLPNPNSAIAAPIPLEEISPHMVEATISTEDNHYWEHKGFDVKGLFRAAWSNYVEDDASTGGSTITQQLVKTTYFTTDCQEVDGIRQCTAPRTVDRKLKELVLSIQTESEYSKEQILAWYLNSISYSGRYVGVESAARGYFEKPASELTLAESALLAGIPSAPTRYHPRLNCQADPETDACITDPAGRTILAGEAKARQEYVLDLMVEHGRLTREAAEAAKAETVWIFPGAADSKSSAFIDSQVEPRLVRMCQAGVLPMREGAEDCVESVHQAGYKVTTTLDWAKTQMAAELLNAQVTAGLAAGCDCHNGSIVTIEPASGQVVVYVPNVDPTWVSDPRVAGHIDQAADVHQPGSSFKPAVYLAWMDGLNKTPMSSIWDTSPLKLVDRPSHPDEQVEIVNPGRIPTQGLITARAALGGSQNVPAFRAAEEAGVDNVIATAKKLGITTLEQFFDPTFRNHDSVYYGPAIATGGANIRVIDMAYMNATIANMGVMVGVPTYASTFDPKDALAVEGAEGDVLERALTQRQAFLNGYLRLPGTRELDPVVVLRVEGANGELLYQHGDDLVRKEVVNSGSVWMLHSIMSDCTARWIIWQCGTSNEDLSLDPFMDGVKIPTGVKTGTQQGVTAQETLETWMNGYTRYAATAVWIGNANKQLVRDGPGANYASANTTVRLFKKWMGAYHASLRDSGMFDVPAGFEELQPENVKYGPFQSANTERGRGGGCRSLVESWQRTDVDYQGGDCKSKACFELPTFKRDLAVSLARSRGIPACGIFVAPRPTAPPQQPTGQLTPGSNQGNPPQANPPRNNPPQQGNPPQQNPPQQNPPQQNPPQQGNPPGQGNNGNGNGNGGDRGGGDDDD